MLYSINYTYYSVKTVKICFHRVGVTRGDLSDSIGIFINIQRLTLRSQFCFDKTFIGGQDATIVITYTD